ncbi:MAG: PKD domain-containing protein, partial [Bacteroidetes bacterium]|nr:PKD domain-containing protein [Bacteroidota bacterium]
LVSGNCFDSTCTALTIGSGPSPCDGLNAGFQVTTEGLEASFYTSGSPNGQVYSWSFGDGTSGQGPAPAHTYASGGQYHACLTVWTWDPATQDTCFADHCEWVVVQGGGSLCDSLNAAFDAVVNGSTVHFISAWNPPGVHHQWSFGDGTWSDNATPTHAYGQPGTYLACLTVFDPQAADTCKRTRCKPIVIGGGNSPCDTMFSVSFTAVQQGGQALFTASSSVPQATYSWSFGDGTSGWGETVEHHFTPGEHLVCVQAWYGVPGTIDTCTAHACQWITVEGSGSPCDSLDAGFQVTTDGLAATFHNNPGNATQAYHWSFGDGTSGWGPMPTHTYAAPGQYHACLTVWTWDPATQDTCFADHCEWVMVQGGGHSPCDSLFQVGYTYGQQGPHVAFHAQAAGDGVHYSWSFGDGTFGMGPNVEHTYAPGEYYACVRAWAHLPGAIDTCFAEYCHWIHVEGDGSPCDSLNAGFQVTTDGLAATFHNNPGNATQAYHWSFGDGTFSDAPVPTHTYAAPGQYHACLTVWAWDPMTQDTCVADHCEWVVVHGGNGSPCDSLLHAAFTWTAGDAAILFQDQSTTNGIPVAHYWDFGDGSVSDTPDPIHHYDQPGQYLVCLTIVPLGATDSCSNTVCRWVSGFGGPPCDSLLHAAFTVIPGDASLFFQDGSSTGGIPVGYFWDFGDGSTSDAQDPIHLYAQPGLYPVCLTIFPIDGMGSCSSTTCHWVDAFGGSSGPCDSLVMPSFDWNADGGVVTLWSTGFGNGLPVSYSWTMDNMPFGTGPQVIYQPSAPGELYVCMTATLYGPDQAILCTTTVCDTVLFNGIVTGVPELPGGADVNTYPQPFTDRLTVQGGLSGSVRFTLMDMAGRVVDDRQLSVQGSTALDYATQPAGPYLLRVRSAMGERTLRVLKQ